MTALDWQIPLWAFGTVIAARIVAGPFLLAKDDARKITELEGRIAEIEDKYPHCLRIEKIDYSQSLQYEGKKVIGREVGFVPVIANKIGYPVEYTVKKLAVNGIAFPITGNLSEVISPQSTSRIFTHRIAAAVNPQGTETFYIDLEYQYGKPGRPSRHAIKRLAYNINHSFPPPDNAAFSNELNEDRSCQ